MIDNEETYKALLHALKQQPLLPNGTRELMDMAANFNPRQVLRRAYRRYADAEMAWYMSKDLCIVGHPGIEDAPIWKACATSNGMVNSNYGWCILSDDNHLQYQHAVDALVKDRWTRQSCCIYTRPSMQLQHNNGLHARRDFICTFATQHMIRDGRLEYIVLMRSNDVETGLPYDLAWHQYIYEKMFVELRAHYEIEYGLIHWHASSLHLYEDRDAWLKFIQEYKG